MTAVYAAGWSPLSSSAIGGGVLCLPPERWMNPVMYQARRDTRRGNASAKPRIDVKSSIVTASGSCAPQAGPLSLGSSHKSQRRYMQLHPNDRGSEVCLGACRSTTDHAGVDDLRCPLHPREHHSNRRHADPYAPLISPMPVASLPPGVRLVPSATMTSTAFLFAWKRISPRMMLA
ncbi:hypothetical protein ABIE33_006827 [Ensifer sp. 4252]